MLCGVRSPRVCSHLGHMTEGLAHQTPPPDVPVSCGEGRGRGGEGRGRGGEGEGRGGTCQLLIVCVPLENTVGWLRSADVLIRRGLWCDVVQCSL